ncbi:aldo/keto reductase [Xylariales sp. AK1849]|nr:aldo/keto reductase [Xylariales sp. AK1849]
MAPPRNIPTSQLGRDGPQVPKLGFGLMGLSVGYGQVPQDEECMKILDRAWELGEVFWDTADAYGDSEALLASKFALKTVITEDGYTVTVDSSPGYCRETCEQSLRLLGTDCIDLYYVHRVDGVTPIEKTLKVLAELKEEGKIKYIGLSECSSSTLKRAHAIHAVTAVQIEYNPWTLDIEKSSGTHLLKTCRELSVAIIAYSPLGRGFLTGRYRSFDDFDKTGFRRSLPRFSPENFPKNLELVGKFERLAERKGCTPAQVVLAWIMMQGDDFFPIPGTKSIKFLEQNLGGLDITVSPTEDREIREIVDNINVSGGRATIGGSFGNTPAME